jgi:hypothetical protein
MNSRRREHRRWLAVLQIQRGRTECNRRGGPEVPKVHEMKAGSENTSLNPRLTQQPDLDRLSEAQIPGDGGQQDRPVQPRQSRETQ